jgi:hypothetical protein
MRTRSKLILAGLTATLLMGLAVSSATAGRFSVSNRNFRVTWANLIFEGQTAEGAEAGLNVTCPVTLEGSFHSATIRKTERALIGAISRGIVKRESCRSNLEPARATILQETLPWHLTYESFAGTLPNITSITVLLRRYAFQLSATIFANRCLYRDAGNPEENQAGIITRNTATGALSTLTPATGRRASFFSGAPFPEQCPPFGRLSGEGQVFLLGNTTRISVTLI